MIKVQNLQQQQQQQQNYLSPEIHTRVTQSMLCMIFLKYEESDNVKTGPLKQKTKQKRKDNLQFYVTGHVNDLP